MSANSETVYIKIEQSVLVHDKNVTLGDIASITSANEAMVRQIKQKKLYRFPDKLKNGKKPPYIQREIFSVLKVIELIHEEYPNAEIDNEGEKDFIIEYTKSEKQRQSVQVIKTIVLCVLIFFGSAFTIMAFNNDISVSDVFAKYYYQIMGIQSNGKTVLEAGYCIGLSVGIFVFFNHVGKKKLTPDPTPIQVEMRQYETDVDTTFIQNAGRKGKETDVS